MFIEHKSVAVSNVSEVKDEGDGIVTAYVSVTGVKDNVNDIIEPGAYKTTLTKRRPKGIWGHDWKTPTSKTLEAKELMPGDPDLPKQLSDGSPWPKDAGALRIKMQFNLDTKRGREAYSDVLFFGNDQEWSIGYAVPPGKATKDAHGVRRIKELDLFEYSAVLFGAMSHARTSSVKDAQLGMKLLEGISALEIKSLEEAADAYRKELGVEEVTDEGSSDFVGDGEVDVEVADNDVHEEELDEDEGDEDPFDDSDVDDEETVDEKSAAELLMANLSVKDLRDAHNVIGKVLSVLEPDDSTARFMDLGYKALIEAKATGHETILDAVNAIDVTLDPEDAKDLRDFAEALDYALDSKDSAAANDAAQDFFEVLEKVMETTDEDDLSLKTVARTVADRAGEEEDEEAEEDDAEDEEEADEEEEDGDWKKHRSKSYVASNGIEYKNRPYAGRTFGRPAGAEDLTVKELQVAYIGSLPNVALLAMDTVLDGTRGNASIKAIVTDEIAQREFIGELTHEEKLRMPIVRGGGQQGRGGGRHRQAAEGRTAGSGKNFGETGRGTKKTAKALKKAVKGVKKPGTSKKTVNRFTGSRKPVSPLRGGDQTQYKRAFTEDRREALAKSGAAMKDGSFPIENVSDLKNAIRACGRAADKEGAKAHIKARAKALGAENLLPEEWKMVSIDTTEIKSLESFLGDLT